MRAPSAKTLLSEFPQLSSEDARLLRSIAGAAEDSEKLRKLIDARVPATAKYVRSLHSDPYRSSLWRTTVALHAMNEVLGTHGVEGLGPGRSGDFAPPYEYLNPGDPYIGTLIYDRKGDRVVVGSWGDIAEKLPEGESDEEHATIRRVTPPAQLKREIAHALSSYRGGR